MQQRAARHQQYMAFKRVAEDLGFARIRECDFRTRGVLLTNSTHEAAADVEWSLDFLSDATTKPRALRTRKPMLEQNKALPNEYLLCFRGISVVHNQMITTETPTELMELLEKSTEMMLEIATGNDVVYERSLARILTGAPGIEVREDGTNAAAGTPNLTVRGAIVPPKEGDDFDDPLLLFPMGSLSITLYGQGAWVTTDNIPLEVQLHGWIANKGGVDAGSKLAQLSDIVSLSKNDLLRRAG